ncbi:MAG: PQQ-binding-like beta-propeller repeat protein [bacterium]|nr:PQQ-binding-like beta-propeller repeat protein [bacterium]
MTKSILLLTFVCLALPSSRLPAETATPPEGGVVLDWPQWRGANRDAVSSESGLLDQWLAGGPTILWRTQAGAGFSSVSVVDGKAYTLWDEDGTQFLLCLDALTGQELWRRELGKAFIHNYGNGPRSTPLIDGGTVFTVGTGGHLVAADMNTGELRWQHDLEREYGANLPPYGYSSSPLVVGDKVVIEAGGKNSAFMAFEKTTGEVVWASEDDQPAYSSPIAVTIDGVDQIVFWSAHGLHAVAPDDGRALWRYVWEELCPVTGVPLNTGTPLFIAPDRIFVSSGSGAAVVRILRVGEKFVVATVWKSEEMRSDVNTSLLLGNYVYGFDRGILKCLDVRTGELMWRARGFQRGSLIAADGKLIVLGEAGNLALIDASPEGFVERASASVLSGKNWTSPSLAGGRLYLRNHDELVCIDMKG